MTRNITVIGAGAIGANLVRYLSRAGHRLTVANSRGPASLAALAAETGAVAAPIEQALASADVIFLAVPPAGIAALAGRLPAEAVVVDPTNYVPGLRDEPVAALEAGGVESRHTEAVLGHPVIKAFNTVNAAQLAAGPRPAGAADRIAVPVAGDDERARRIVIELAGQIGFDGFDAGPLDESWRQQPGTPIYTTALPPAAAAGALAAADPAQTRAWRTRMARPPRPAPDRPASAEADRPAATGGRGQSATAK